MAGQRVPSCAKLRISSDPPAFKFPVKPRALAMTTQGVEMRRKSPGAQHSVKDAPGATALAVAEARGPLYVPKFWNKSLRLSIDLKTRKPESRVDIKEETSEQAVNRSLLLRAMQTAIARGLRARNEPPVCKGAWSTSSAALV